MTALYRELTPQLRRVLGGCIRAPEWVLEDACQIAWARWLADPSAIAHEQLLSWLATTARREVIRVFRHDDRERSIGTGPGGIGSADGPVADQGWPDGPAGELVPLQPVMPLPIDAVVELRERLRTVERLPLRQRRMLWLNAAGYRQHEIADATDESRRVVDRQLRSARRQLYRIEAAPPASTKATRRRTVQRAASRPIDGVQAA